VVERVSVEEEALLLRAVTRGIKTTAIGAIVRLREMVRGRREMDGRGHLREVKVHLQELKETGRLVEGCETDFRRERIGIGTHLLMVEELGTEVLPEVIEIGAHRREVDVQGTERLPERDEMTGVFPEAGEIDLQMHGKAEIGVLRETGNLH